MELKDLIKKRRMVRRYAQDPVPDDVLNRILWAGRRAPSAGFSQGLDLVVLRGPEQVEKFWKLTIPADSLGPLLRDGPTVIILPIPDVQAYLDRYSLPDKEAAGKQTAESWPMPYWDLDAAMAVMLMLLSAEDEGLGAIFTGIFANEREMLDSLGVPAGRRPIGVVGLGYVNLEGPGDPGSARVIPKRKPSEVIHWGRW
ncbi:MAG: nitroreductase family protein [Candidatus Dormibacteraceae bacterium]